MPRAKKKKRGRSSRPRILRFRWTLLTRSPRWMQLTVLFLALLVFVGFARLRRSAAPRGTPPAPVAADA